MKYTQRIFWPQYHSEEKLSKLFHFLHKHRSICDEISFFTEGDGMDWRYVPRDEILRRSIFLKYAVARAREEGFIPVINILNTLGHSDEGGEDAPVVPWNGAMDIYGAQTRQCSCPADSAFLDYVRFKYEAYGSCGADRYWIDDDVRMGNHKPANWTCFCDHCLADFSTRMGRPFDRTALIHSLSHDREIRSAWVHRNGEVVMNLLEACAVGLSRSHPQSEIGLMCCDVVGLLDAEADFPKWFSKFESITGAKWLRPGGGYWSDRSPRDAIHKALTVANTVGTLPAGVKTAYEVENYPFTLGTKSAQMTGLECLIATLGSRLDGIMFDVLDLSGNDLAPYDQWFAKLASWQPLCTRAHDLVLNTSLEGWRPVYSTRHFQQHTANDDPLKIPPTHYTDMGELQLSGLPITGFPDNAFGNILVGHAAHGMSDAELQLLLLKPLIMDGEAARLFVSRGLGSHIGIQKIDSTRTEGTYEEFSDHLINEGMIGYKRCFSMKYFNATSHVLVPSANAETLNYACNYKGERLGSATTLYRPKNAAPVIVSGHATWTHNLSPQKMRQWRRISDATIGSSLFLSIDSPLPVVFYHRRDASKKLAILLNPNFDENQIQLSSTPGKRIVFSLELSTPQVEISPDSLTLPPWGLAIISIA